MFKIRSCVNECCIGLIFRRISLEKLHKKVSGKFQRSQAFSDQYNRLGILPALPQIPLSYVDVANIYISYSFFYKEI